jgi:hypothetical protein
MAGMGDVLQSGLNEKETLEFLTSFGCEILFTVFPILSIYLFNKLHSRGLAVGR